MGDGPEKFKAMSFLLERIALCDFPYEFDFRGMQLISLPFSRRIDNRALSTDGTTGRELPDHGLESLCLWTRHDLQSVHARAIVDIQKGHFLAMTHGPKPSLYPPGTACGRTTEHASDRFDSHSLPLSISSAFQLHFRLADETEAPSAASPPH
jgi:hypothetical protein